MEAGVRGLFVSRFQHQRCVFTNRYAGVFTLGQVGNDDSGFDIAEHHRYSGRESDKPVAQLKIPERAMSAELTSLDSLLPAKRLRRDLLAAHVANFEIGRDRCR